MLFIDYTNAILQSYNIKREKGLLSSRLAHPSPAELRDECEAAFEKPYNHHDAIILKTFFGQFNNRDEGLRCIKNHPIDKFRPLVKFLKGGINEPKKKNINLIAWLIDFKPRPFELEKNYTCLDNADPEIVDAGENTAGTSGVEKNQDLEEQEKVEHQPGQPPKEPSASPAKKRGFKIIAGSSVAVALALSGVFINKIKDEPPPARSGHCMYWAGDHYEPSPCTPKRGDTLLVKLDSAKLFRFKKIASETITKDDIGRVAYVKLDGRIEYYTDTGSHPVYTHKRLKPLTKFMFDKYILPLEP